MSGHIFKDKNNNLSDLLMIIDTIPPESREWNDVIVGYHITYIENLENIKQNGLQMNSSKQSYDRPECVYLFLDNEIEKENIPVLLGDVEQYAILTIKLPNTEINKLKFDGLYNVSFDFGYGAAMYFDNILTDYITEVEIFNYQKNKQKLG